MWLAVHQPQGSADRYARSQHPFWSDGDDENFVKTRPSYTTFFDKSFHAMLCCKP